MKRYKYIFLSAVLLFSSCDGFLDKEPENSRPVSSIDYTITKNMDQPVIGIYARARTGDGFSFWGRFGLMSIRGDDVEKGSTPSDQGELNYAKSFEYNQLGGYWALNGSWTGLYNMVLQCNSALIDLASYNEHVTSDADKRLNLQYQAEVRFIRAFAYFHIVRFWGDILLVTDNEQVFKAMEVTSREDIYNFINAEMDFCANNLPALRPNEMPMKGRVTKYTALGLKAKANADINDWDAVLNATNEIIESNKFELYPDFYDYFKKPGCLSDENLFELQYGLAGVTDIESDAWFEYQGPRQGFEGTKIGTGWGFMVPSKSLEKLFNDRGETVRKETTFLYAGSTTREGDIMKPSVAADGHDRVFNGKNYIPSTQMPVGKTKYGYGNHIRMIRYADILLLNAEAKVHKGQNGDIPFNLVRTRAEMSTLTNVTLDQILEERQVELACEWGERYFDLIRTGKAEGTLPGFKAGKSEFYPIPQAQKDLNPNLK
ncbi:RagB/SusD family nutrient uptake outer membrane protein [Dysgonomonas sp. Marseille-P4677]|uniref:RagB/SusD family nutrient uptake outer membrane protein n=1 Tax=Dysgonomonas sp. Marseille-P4677 TaxID=2364790 RepID=UPI001911878B|nr:RagB/SusD family nutrient uptake outer membrane protein [Dysgonomonas sp. Marseille-P4677]MBK5720856.1 RagB/SusD family nutrient uptake outer membrane protein [Dysgonomonas sp. Marseille-P4677]